MGMKTKPRILGGAGALVSGLWAAYSSWTTVSQLPQDAGGLAKMLADPPIYLPWLLLAGFVILLAWSLWPHEDPARPEKSPDILPGSTVITNPTGNVFNIHHHYGAAKPEEGEAKEATQASIASPEPIPDTPALPQSKELRAWELLNGDDPIVRDKTFEDCVIRGPAMISFIKNNDVSEVDFGGRLDDILVEVSEGRRVVGVIGFDGCTFRRCSFRDIGILGTRDLLDAIRKGTKE